MTTLLCFHAQLSVPILLNPPLAITRHQTPEQFQLSWPSGRMWWLWPSQCTSSPVGTGRKYPPHRSEPDADENCAEKPPSAFCSRGKPAERRLRVLHDDQEFDGQSRCGSMASRTITGGLAHSGRNPTPATTGKSKPGGTRTLQQAMAHGYETTNPQEIKRMPREKPPRRPKQQQWESPEWASTTGPI